MVFFKQVMNLLGSIKTEFLDQLSNIFPYKTCHGIIVVLLISLHNEELHGLYSSPSIIRVIKTRRMRWAGHVACMGDVRCAYNILVGRPEGRRPLGRPRRRWEGNIKMDVTEIGFGDVEWIHLAQDRDRWLALVNTVMNLRVP
jgi:hypothetical protein